INQKSAQPYWFIFKFYDHLTMLSFSVNKKRFLFSILLTLVSRLIDQKAFWTLSKAIVQFIQVNIIYNIIHFLKKVKYKEQQIFNLNLFKKGYQLFSKKIQQEIS
ncbi:hypothetical protein IMG5_028110, partial [Ichthyophthirius multifiliis]